MATVVRFGDTWIAGGSDASDAAVWRSRDGRTWTRVRADALRSSSRSREGMVVDLAVVGETLVAVGMEGGQDSSRARAWWSTDGSDWQRAPMDGARDGQVFSVADTGAELLATGPSGGCPGIWSTTEGRRWACAASGPRMQLFGPYAAAANDEIEVAVGLTNEGWDEDSGEAIPGAIWWRPRP